MDSGCRRRPNASVLSSSAPQAVFYRLCDAYQRDDYETAYNTFSAKMKKALSEAPEGAIRNASDLRKAYEKRGDEVKTMAKGATVNITLLFENYAQGIIVWGDGTTQSVWFTKENGIWRIDLGVEEGATSVSPGEGATSPNTPRPQP
jgi:hypothetical protein